MEDSRLNIHREIIEKCKDGDRMSQNKLYKLYSKAMFNICYRITNDHSDAEDILQEAFISAFQNLNSYKGNSSFGAWLKRIVVNRAINHMKRKRLETTSWENEQPIAEGTEVFGISENDVILNLDRVKKAIQRLPDGYRVVFSLYLLEGYDHGEIASILDISESTSKSQYNRSKKKLKEILRKEVYHEGRKI